MDNEQKIAALEEENSNLRLKLRAIIHALPGSIYYKSLDGVYLGANARALNMVGISSEEQIIGKTDFDLFSQEHAELFRLTDLKVIKENKEIVEEEVVISPDGKKLTQLSSKKPLKDDKGNVIGIVGNTINITHLKETEAALSLAKEQAEAASKAKSDFLANMSHDVKTPISGIIGMSEVLLSQLRNINHQEYVRSILKSGRKVLDFFENCIQLSKIESNHLNEIFTDNFSVKKLLEDIVTLFLPSIRFKKIIVDTYIDPKVPSYITANYNGIYRVLINLVGNAIKFTAEGSITVSAFLSEVNSQEIKISVKDTGIGIDEADQPNIFDQFSKLSPSYEGKYEGSGIGLYVVKKTIELMQGRIQVISKRNEGSNFVVYMPFKIDNGEKKSLVQQKKEYSGKREMPRHHLNILVVEDDPIAQIIAKELLSKTNCHVSIACSGAEGVSMYKSKKYDIVFLDIGLPDIDGYTVAKQMKENALPIFHAPIIALTAHAANDVEQACKEAKITKILSKPLSLEKINACINEYVYGKKPT